MTTKAQQLDAQVKNQVYLEGLKANQFKQFDNFLKSIDKDLRKRLSGDELSEFSRGRLKKILRTVDASLAKSFDDYQKGLIGDLYEIGVFESEFEADELEQISSGFDIDMPQPQQVRAAIFSRPLSVRGVYAGKLLEPFVSDWTKAERSALLGIVRQGAYEGRTNAEMLRELRGTRARGYRDGALNIANNHAKAIIRTSVQHVASVARFETWNKNKGLVEGYEWVSTLDGRTSPICRPLDGKVFKLNKGPMPPVHVACRSTTIAKLNSKYDVLDKGAVRASKDGPTSASENYYDWLKRQDAEFQDDVLGKKRAQLFRKGGLSSKKFGELMLDKKFRPMTLEDIRKRAPRVWAKAFAEPAPQKPRRSARPKSDFDTSTEAGQWHDQALAGSSAIARKIAIKNQDVELIYDKKRGAYAQAGRLINMSRYNKNQKKAQSVWRHEFGHILDVRIGSQAIPRARNGYRSSEPDFKSASRSDGTQLRKGRSTRDDKKIALASIEENQRESARLFKKLKISEPAFRKMINETTSDKSSFSGESGARKLRTLLDAIDRRDAEQFADTILSKGSLSWGDYLREYDKDGAWASFTDLIGSCTRNDVCGRQRGYSGHSNAYYRSSSHRAYTESFANLNDAFSHSDELIFDIFRRFAPKMGNLFEQIMKGQ